MSEFAPVEVYPLASFIGDEMTARGWDTAELAARMKPDATIKDIVGLDLILCVHTDGLIIDDETFSGFARAFGVSEQYFRNLHETWGRWPDRREPYEPPEHILSGAAWSEKRDTVDGES